MLGIKSCYIGKGTTISYQDMRRLVGLRQNTLIALLNQFQLFIIVWSYYRNTEVGWRKHRQKTQNPSIV